jgi:tetratricopeptide (TPR) repeat protein
VLPYLAACGLLAATLIGCAAFLFGATPVAHGETAAPTDCKRGEALEGLNRFGAAEEAYLENLKSPATEGCGGAGLKRLGGARLCAAANSLARAGQVAKAEEAYEKVLATDPDSACAVSGLEHSKTFWEELEGTAKDVSSVGGAVLAGLAFGFGALVAIVLILLQPLTRCRWTRDRAPARWFVSPDIEVKAPDAGWMEKDYGPQFASLVRARVSFKRPGGISLVTGHAGISEALKPLGEISEAKAALSVVTFVEALLPRRNFEVAGALHPDAGSGEGVSIELTNDQRNVQNGTLWGDEFGVADGDANAVQELAVPAAAWVDFQLVKALGATEYMVSTDATSWALFEAGSDWFDKHDLKKAAALYEKALEADGLNAGALANLGLVRGIQRQYTESVELLQKGLAQIEAGKYPTHLNPDWYRVKFNLAGTRADWGYRKGVGGVADLTKAHNEAHDLLVKALRVRLEPWRRKGWPTEALFKTLDKIVPAALAVYAATARASVLGQPPAAGPALRPQRVLAELERNNLGGSEALDYALAIQGRQPETLYNIACAQARRGEFDDAIARLLAALRSASAGLRRRLAQEALDDPSLAVLRESGPFRAQGLEAKLRAMTTPPTPAKPPAPADPVAKK